MNPVQDFVRLATSDDLRLMRICREVFVTEPAIGDDMRSGLDGLADETVQRL